MKILVVGNYPRPSQQTAGVFNERSVHALRKLCDRVEVLVPSPYAPTLLLSLVPRWKALASTPGYETRNGITVCRASTLVIPRFAQAFWSDQGAFLWCRRVARQMHRRAHFDAIISFDLMGAGGLAWRLGRDLEIPASGWATGSDVRVSRFSSHGRTLARTLKNLDLVFYQSHELLEKAAALLGTSADQLSGNRHMVLPRGIPEPPALPRADLRNRTRVKWGIRAEEVVVLYLGTISRQKGMLELLEALKLAASRVSKIRCVLVGCKPALDDTDLIKKTLSGIPWLSERVMLLPACSPDSIWGNLCAADIFAFPSHNEGMPNSLLEAMAMSLPAIAFGIPAVQELEAGTGGLMLVPPLDSRLFAEAILRLAVSSEERKRLGEKGKAIVMDRFMVRTNMAEAFARVAELIQTQIPSKSEAAPFGVASNSSAV